MNKLSDTNNKINRRDFLYRSLLTWIALTSLSFLYSIIKYIYPSRKKYLTYNFRNDPGLLKKELKLSEIAENSSKLIQTEETELLIIRYTGNDLKIFDATCTHLDCIVGYRKEYNDIYCNCHGGRYDINGNVLDGPPKRSLKKYDYEIADDKILIKT